MRRKERKGRGRYRIPMALAILMKFRGGRRQAPRNGIQKKIRRTCSLQLKRRCMEQKHLP